MRTFFQIPKKQKIQISFKWVFFLIIYQMATSLYPLLSPLMGFMFCYLVFLVDDEIKTKDEDEVVKYLAFLYLIFIDLNKGFYLFSGVIAFLIFYYIFSEWVNTSIKCKNCVIFVFVASGYLSIFGINNLIAYILNEDFFEFGFEYGIYILFDFLLTVVYYKDRLS